MCPMARWLSTFSAHPTSCEGRVKYRLSADPAIPPFWSCDEHAPEDEITFTTDSEGDTE
jgi:hypothetical protein